LVSGQVRVEGREYKVSGGEGWGKGFELIEGELPGERFGVFGPTADDVFEDEVHLSTGDDGRREIDVAFRQEYLGRGIEDLVLTLVRRKYPAFCSHVFTDVLFPQW
jgi:hypothetical protein